MKKTKLNIEPLKQTVTRVQLMKIHEKLSELTSLRGIQFVNAIERNMVRMDRIFNQTRNWARKNSPESQGKLKEYYDEYQKLTQEYAKKYPNGQPKLDQFGAVQITNKEEYGVKMKLLDEKYPAETKLLADFDKRYEQLLSIPIEFEWYMILYDNLPEDMSMEEKASIQFLIVGDPLEEEFKAAPLDEIPDDFGLPNDQHDSNGTDGPQGEHGIPDPIKPEDEVKAGNGVISMYKEEVTYAKSKEEIAQIPKEEVNQVDENQNKQE